jgi:lysophospholipase L1-like esterase
MKISFLKNKFLSVLCLLMCGALSACESDDEQAYCAIGDSLIARWDMQNSFPAHQTYNRGVSGSGIDYLEQQQNSCAGKTLFVLSGTNDLDLIREDLNAYTARYLTAIERLGGQPTYVISLLPRDFDGDAADLNELIVRFNAQVQAEVASRPTLRYIDVHDAFTKDGTMNRQLSFDGLHLNDYGYELLSSILSPYIQ